VGFKTDQVTTWINQASPTKFCNGSKQALKKVIPSFRTTISTPCQSAQNKTKLQIIHHVKKKQGEVLSLDHEQIFQIIHCKASSGPTSMVFPKSRCNHFSLFILPNGTTQEHNENLFDRQIHSIYISITQTSPSHTYQGLLKK